MKIEIEKVTETKLLSDPEWNERWIAGVAVVLVGVGAGRQEHEIEVGCWEKTSNDNYEWNESLEGEIIIAAVVDGEELSVGIAFPQECKLLGEKVCKLLRARALHSNTRATCAAQITAHGGLGPTENLEG